MHSILIVDDLESIHGMLESVIEPIGYNMTFATDGTSAIEKYREFNYDVVLTDINMEPMDGLTLLNELKSINEKVIVIIMSGFANEYNAMEALKRGAFDYLTKPFKVDQLIKAIERAGRAQQKLAAIEIDFGPDPLSSIIGRSDSIHALKKSIEKLSNTRTPILIHGEEGTQKSLVASILHSLDQARTGTFVTVNCERTSTDDICEKLIGDNCKGGSLTRSAYKGTLYLESVESLPRDLQSNVAETIRNLREDVHVLCSTSADLDAQVENGQFDDSLFYRIGNVTISLPALREREEDLPLLALAILEKLGKQNIQIDEEAVSLMQAYRWPGNEEELKEVILDISPNLDSIINADLLPDKLQDVTHLPPLKTFMFEATEKYKRQVLRACSGDRSRAAVILGCAEAEF